MTPKSTFLVILLNAIYALLISNQVAADNNPSRFLSPYSGEQARTIKSLSKEDIEQLQQGEGWGLAKAAELNGVPGPLHLLELKEEINLSLSQTQKINKLYQSMKSQAIPLGQQLIHLESKINQLFIERNLNSNELEKLLLRAGETEAKLRMVHLSAHLQTPQLLSEKQIYQYNKLRGYDNANCDNVPKGHNPKMWRMHNNCQEN